MIVRSKVMLMACCSALLVGSATAAVMPPTRGTDTGPVKLSGVAQLHGRLCHWGDMIDGSGSRLDFDGSGLLRFTAEPAFGSNTFVATEGALDNSVQGHYRVAGRHVYLKLDDGTRAVGWVRKRETDGQVDELLINGNRYAAQLCQ